MPPYTAAAPGGFYPGLYPGLGGQQGAYQYQQQSGVPGAQTAAPQVNGDTNNHDNHKVCVVCATNKIYFTKRKICSVSLLPLNKKYFVRGAFPPFQTF